MKVSSITLTSALALACALTHASIVTISSTPLGSYLTDASGVSLADGSLVWVGNFADASMIDTALPVQELAANTGWEWFGDTQVISIFDNPGKVSGVVVNNTSTAERLESKPIYLWVFNGPTIFESTEYGIFTVQTGSTPWVFGPAGDGGQGFVNMDDLNLIALVGSVDGNRLVLTGMIPEPATYAVLLGVAAIGVALVRRRAAK